MANPASLTRQAIAGIRPAMRSPLFRVASARVVTFPVTVGCGLLWLRVVIGNTSTADYALVAVVVGLQFLLSFLDFGTTAHILDEAGRFAVHKVASKLGVAIGQAVRTIIIGNLAVLGGAVVVFATGSWGPILGFPTRSATVGLAILLILGINLVARPLSLANSLVAGLGHPTVAQWAQVAASLLTLAGAVACVTWDLPLPWLVTTPILGQLIASLIPLAVSSRSAPGLIRSTIKGVFTRGASPTRLRHLAAPMLFIQIVAPLNDQLDRVILSHLSTVKAVAVYSLTAQFFSSAVTVISSMFPTLWVHFAELRELDGERGVVDRAFRYARRVWLPSLAVGLALTLVIAFLGPVASAHRITPGWVLCLALGLTFPVVVVRSIFGLALTDAWGLRAQAVLAAVVTALNLTLSISLAQPLGALGPVLASLLAILVDAGLMAVILRRRRSRAAVPSREDAMTS
jgi:O-antigen/teichoic acid export membrane protein